MLEDRLLHMCKKLRFGSSLVNNAKKINAPTHMEFLLELFAKELEERDRKRRNYLLSAARFDILKTFEDIKFPPALSTGDLISMPFVPRKENLILYGNVGAGKTHLAIATGTAFT